MSEIEVVASNAEIEVIVPAEADRAFILTVAQQGPPGAPGAAGGASSNTVLYGSTVPSNGLGADGNFYIRTDTGVRDVYGPKAGGVWPAPTSMLGAQGPAGADGANGAQGIQGIQGLQGPQGLPGAAGADGADGADGAQGPAGPAGQSAYQIAVAAGFVGNEAAWLASLVGPQGPAGADGADGAQGPAGTNGTNGTNGAQGPAGPAGPAEVSTLNPSTPSTGTLALARDSRAGRDRLATKDASGKKRAIQHALMRQRTSFMCCTLGSLSGFGVNVATVTGTQTFPTPAAGLVARQRRALYTSAATASAGAGWNDNTINVYPVSGFSAAFLFSIEDAAAVSTARHIVGFKGASTALGGTDPSSFTDCFFIGADAGDTNLQFMYNDNTGTCTKVDLGIDKGTTGELFEANFHIAPEGTTVSYELIRLSDGSSVSGSVDTNLPSAATGLRPFMHRGNGSTTAAVAIGVLSYYLETEY